MSEIIVKPLEWLSDKSPFFASSPFCRYRIAPVDDDTGPHWQTSVSYQGSTYRRSDTEAEAKAAAQSDYEQRILSAIDLEGHKALIEKLADKIEDLIYEFGDDPKAALECISEYLQLRRQPAQEER